jgi:hypothetical protein
MNNSHIATVAPAKEKPAKASFLGLPVELRVMVYRELLVSRHRIHLHCFLPEKINCMHSRITYTCILRACHQMTSEALDVLYGENNFVFTVFIDQPIIMDYFSRANLLRLRKLSIEHPLPSRHRPGIRTR